MTVIVGSRFGSVIFCLLAAAQLVAAQAAGARVRSGVTVGVMYKSRGK